MLTLDPPVHTAQQTFTVCISKVRDPLLKGRLAAVATAVKGASDEYEAAALSQSLHDVAGASLVGGDVTKNEMESVYTDRMAKKGSPGRYIYDELFSAPAQGRCPLCGHRTVKTLDHHLPKAHYPALAVAPLNLVPSCYDCNRAKLDAVPTGAADVSLHPYFDKVDNKQWLKAVVIQTRPTALRFYAAPPDEMGTLLQNRIRNHFRRLDLAALYASEAAEELLNIRHQLANILAAGGRASVQSELESRALSAAHARRNGWRTVTYETWAADEWFCDGGFSYTE